MLGEDSIRLNLVRSTAGTLKVTWKYGTCDEVGRRGLTTGVLAIIAVRARLIWDDALRAGSPTPLLLVRKHARVVPQNLPEIWEWRNLLVCDR